MAPGLTDLEKLQDKWKSLRHVQHLLPNESVADCMCMIRDSSVKIVRQNGVASFRGLVSCKSPWVCPVCAPRITERRAHEVSRAVKAAPSAGLQCVMLSLTVAHGAGDELKPTIAALLNAWKRLTSGRAWSAVRSGYGYVGAIRALEVTFGRLNGWHPHLHVLAFVSEGVNVAQLQADLLPMWERALATQGLTCNEHGLRADATSGRIAAYISKFGREPKWTPGRELAKHPSKVGRTPERWTPFGLLSLSASGVSWASDRFVEYASAVKGRAQLHYSPGLRKLLGLDETTDAELIEQIESTPAEVVCELSPHQWYRVYSTGSEAAVLWLARTATESELLCYIDGLSPPGMNRAA